MAGDELVELKFRLADGSDIGPSKYNSSATVSSLKEKIIAQWPRDKENGPKSINDIKLINAGRILENNRTLAESRLPLSEVPGGVITMLVVVRPPIPDKNSACITPLHHSPPNSFIDLENATAADKLQGNSQKKGGCFCSIL